MSWPLVHCQPPVLCSLHGPSGEAPGHADQYCELMVLAFMY